MKETMDDSNDFNLLIVDDEQDVQRSLRRLLGREPYKMFFCNNGVDALTELSEQSFDLMLLDLKMPGMDGLSVLKTAIEKNPLLKVIIFTGHGGVKEAVTAIKYGAVDFYEKIISPELLRTKINMFYQDWLLQKENKKLRAQITRQFTFEQLLGESPGMLKLKEMIARVSPTDTSVLIQGESGTGKELVARAIHHQSHRHAEVFIPIDCASLNDTVVESELFGHVKGAFTGADQETLGLFRCANKGTVFLDEIAELPLNMQVKLLRTLQEREVRPVGSTVRKKVDIRIVAATNCNLLKAVEEGQFRQDLYYRLSSVTLTIPPLRERKEDIPLLCDHIIREMTKEGLPKKILSRSVLSLLQSYPLKGNFRELENILKYAMTFSSEDVIQPADIDMNFSGQQQPIIAGDLDRKGLASIEEAAIRRALIQTSGSRREAARLLEISETTLYRRLRQYKLES